MNNRTRIRDLLNKFFLSTEDEALLHELLRGMTEITFYQNDNIRPSGVVRLAEALQREESTITRLRIHDTNMEDYGVNAIAAALYSPYCKLDTLVLGYIDNNRATAIAHALQSPHCKVTRLGLSFNQIGNNGAIAIADALKSPNCRLNLLDISHNPFIGQTGINAIANALKVNMTLTTFIASWNIVRDGDEEVSLNRMIKNLFFKFFVQENLQKKLHSDVVKDNLTPYFNFNNDTWKNLYWEEMKNISSLSRFVNYLDTSDPINVKKKIKRRILFLKRNKIENHVPAQLLKQVQNVLYNDVQQQQIINNIGRKIYDIQLRLKEDRDRREAVQRGTPSSHHQSSSSP
jgi:hypothetical protein